jgi:hypothetical protein
VRDASGIRATGLPDFWNNYAKPGRAFTSAVTPLARPARSPYDDYVESFYLFQRECADAMLKGGAVIQAGAANLKTLTSTFAAYEAATTGKVIEFLDYE